MKLPLEQHGLLARMKGSRLVGVKRDVLPYDYTDLPAAERDQTAFGSLELTFEGNLVIAFFPFPEPMSIGVYEEPKEISDWVHLNLTSSPFWQPLVGARVAKVSVLIDKNATSVYPSQFGVLATMTSGETFLVEYVETDEIRISRSASHLRPRAYTIKQL